jgi:predicted Ser/Thr protein kinase
VVEKRDLQLIRLAVRRGWLSAEEGEDVLFLKKKFGPKYTIEEVVRRRGYLDDEAIQELAKDADASLKRGPGLFRKAEPESKEKRPEKTIEKAPAKPATVTRAPPKPSPPSVVAKPSQPSAPKAASAVRRPPPSIAKPREGSAIRPGSVVAKASEAPAVQRSKELSVARPRPLAPLKPLEPFKPSEPPAPAKREATGVRPAPRPVSRVSLGPRPPTTAKPVQAKSEAPAPEPKQAPPSRIADKFDPFEGPTFEGADEFSDHTNVELLDAPQGTGTIDVPSRIEEPSLPPEIAAKAPFKIPKGERTVLSAVEEIRKHLSVPPPPPPAGLPDIDDDEFEGESTAVVAALAKAEARPPARRSDTPLAVTPDGEVQVRRPVADEDAVPTDGHRPAIRADLPPPAEEIGDEEVTADLQGEFGRYNIRRLIGRGSMGSVYLGEPIGGGELLAIKVLHPAVARDPEFFQRFLREAAAAAAIDSPHVVPLLDVGTVDRYHYIAMAYIDGWTLRERLESGDEPTLLEAVRIARDVAKALAAAEEVDLIHRDVKPENILIAHDGSVFLTDFGLAHNKAKTSIPPDQSEYRADIYRLGATLFHVLVRRSVMSGQTTDAAVAKLVREGTTDIRKIDPTIPEELGTIVTRLLSKKAEDRFETAADVVIDLDRLIEDLGPDMNAEVTRRGLDASGWRRLTARAFAISAVLVAVALGVSAFARASEWVSWGQSDLVVRSALLGAGGVFAGLLLLGALALVRRGELPLPGSTGWIVGVKDATGAFGAGAVVTSATLGPPAILNLGTAILAAIVLASWTYGFMLRRTVANLRADRGVGHMLAVLGDPKLRNWHRLHAPMVTLLAFFAAARFALLAYFHAS